MIEFLHHFVLAFVPMFVAVDPVGLLPLYLGLTEGTEPQARRKILLESLLTAMAISVGFVLFGNILLKYIGVTVNDFRIAGGALLFIISTLDIISTAYKRSRHFLGNVGVVPLGTPLIAGPAVLTASLILISTQGTAATLLALVINIALAGVVLSSANFMTRVLGLAGSRAVSKVSDLILAAFAVMMIREGVINVVQQAR